MLVFFFIEKDLLLKLIWICKCVLFPFLLWLSLYKLSFSIVALIATHPLYKAFRSPEHVIHWMERFVEKRFEIWQPLQYQVISNERQNTQTHIFQKSIIVECFSLSYCYIITHAQTTLCSRSCIDRMGFRKQSVFGCISSNDKNDILLLSRI